MKNEKKNNSNGFLGLGVEWYSKQEQWGQEAKDVLKFELYRHRYGTVWENERISGDGKLIFIAYSRYWYLQKVWERLNHYLSALFIDSENPIFCDFRWLPVEVRNLCVLLMWSKINQWSDFGWKKNLSLGTYSQWPFALGLLAPSSVWAILYLLRYFRSFI